MIHYRKITPSNFELVTSKVMSFQLRKGERFCEIGDVLVLQEYCPILQIYTGAQQVCRVNHILGETEGIEKGYSLLNIELLSIHITESHTREITNIIPCDIRAKEMAEREVLAKTKVFVRK